MIRATTLAALVCAIVACSPPASGPGPTPTPTESPVEKRPKSLADIEPVRVQRGRIVELPGTSLAVEIVEWQTGHGTGPDGGLAYLARGTFRFTAKDGRTETVTWSAETTLELLGARLYLQGGVDETFIYVLPVDQRD